MEEKGKDNKQKILFIATIAIAIVLVVAVIFLITSKSKLQSRKEFYKELVPYSTKYLMEDTTIDENGNTVTITTRADWMTKSIVLSYDSKSYEMISGSCESEGKHLQEMADDHHTGYTVIFKMIDGDNPDIVLFASSGGEVIQELPH